MTDKGRHERDLEEQVARQAREVAEAERGALASGKERFDLGRLEQLMEQAPGSKAAVADTLRRQYYIVHTDVRTLAEYAALVRQLEVWD